MTSPAMDRMLATLRDKGPMTRTMLASTAFVSDGTVKAYLRRALESRQIHVQRGELGATVYAYGPGDGAPVLPTRSPRFPEPTTLERADPYLERQRAAEVLARVDPITKALMGLSA